MNLVTGATGIVGSHVVYQLLRDGLPVLATKRANSDLSEIKALFNYYTGNDSLFERINWIELELNDIGALDQALNNVTHVYHCAGMVSFNPAHRKQLILANEKGTSNIVNICLIRNISLCHVSSVATIHNLDYKMPLDETVFWKKSGKESDYAVSKYNAEKEVWRGIEEGLSAVIVNPGLIIAPGFWQRSSMRLLNRINKGNNYYTEGIVATIGAHDLASAMIKLVSKKKFGARYIAIENNYSYKHLLSSFASSLKKPLPKRAVGPGLLKVIAWLEKIKNTITGGESELSSAVIHSVFNKQTFSAEKLKTELAMTFTSLNELASEAGMVFLEQKGGINPKKRDSSN